jgi:Pentapeptide repeats (9 copies)
MLHQMRMAHRKERGTWSLENGKVVAVAPELPTIRDAGHIVETGHIMPRMSPARLPVRRTQPVYKSVTAGTVLNAMTTGSGGNFDQAEISGSICLKDFSFSEPVRFSNCDFSGELDLSGCRFNKGFSFIGCVFEQEVRFEGARADADCQFRACVFYKECRFDRLHVNGKLDVRAPRSIEALKGNRYYTQDGKTLKYTPYVIFKERATFSQIHISGEANFGSVQFLKGADFYNARIDGPAFFRRDGCKEKVEAKKFEDELFENTCFAGTARFRDAHFGSELDFKGAEFQCHADFTYVRCQGIVFFCDELKPKEKPKYPCKFHQNLDFEGGRFETSLRLDTAEFNDEHEVNFRDCRIAESLGFTGVPRRLIMTGCSYKRVECEDSDKFVEALKQREDTQKKFDRSSWVQLETTLRNSGEVQRADAVYRDRMVQERKWALVGYQKLLNRVWELAAGYGTAPWKLAVICCLMLLIGTFALRLGQFKPVTKDDISCRMSTGMAFEVTLAQFSPFKLPVGEDCAPEGWSIWIALFLRIAGWILVPLLAANLAGLLHRKAVPARESGGGDE